MITIIDSFISLDSVRQTAGYENTTNQEIEQLIKMYFKNTKDRISRRPKKSTQPCSSAESREEHNGEDD